METSIKEFSQFEHFALNNKNLTSLYTTHYIVLMHLGLCKPLSIVANAEKWHPKGEAVTN